MKPHACLAGAILISWNLPLGGADLSMPRFRAQEIDSKIEIGYAVTVADVDGDRKPDILVVDKKQIVWYRNPTWEKFVIAENLTELDNVCIAAADIDGDGKAEIAVGAGWNPGDTVNSGAVFYLIAPEDRTQKWTAVRLPHEPTTHRMRWMPTRSGKYDLVVAPLHGRGNKNGEGAGVRILRYKMPADPRATWSTEVVSDSMHMTHNIDITSWTPQRAEEMLVAGKEGIFRNVNDGGRWESWAVGGQGEPGFSGAGEVRDGKLPGGLRFLATVEPMHGSQLVVYTEPKSIGDHALWPRHVIDSSLKEGHALACGDLLGVGSDQIVIGWRGKDAQGKVGIKIFVPTNPSGLQWSQSVLDDNEMACEDLCLADLNGDGKLDVIASGRATKNVKVYFNEGSH